MPFRKGEPRPPTAGRRKGTPNAINRGLREMIRAALEGAGGQAYLQRQAEENPNGFLTLLAKCLPKDLNVASQEPITIRWSGEMRERRPSGGRP
jgi:hypothetical protein